MKKNYVLLHLVLLLSTLLVGSCHKIVDYWPDHTPPHYRIKSIFFDEWVAPHTGNFYYNKWGNPDSVIFGFVATGRPNYYFTYNKKQQLREIKSFYINGSYEQWRRFGLDKKGQIVSDTVYNFGSQNQDPEPSNYTSKRIDYYEYDNQGRIVKRIFNSVDPAYEPIIINFVYNADGNLDDPNIIEQYDNNRNLLTLHPIWQFLQCNYSVNNPFPATSYNSYRLPTRFDFPLENFISRFPFFAARGLEKSEIIYEDK